MGQVSNITPKPFAAPDKRMSLHPEFFLMSVGSLGSNMFKITLMCTRHPLTHTHTRTYIWEKQELTGCGAHGSTLAEVHTARARKLMVGVIQKALMEDDRQSGHTLGG